MRAGEEGGFWTEPRIAMLKNLWSQGTSANAIARDIGDGCTRNQVIGKAHRIGLDKRPSPIKPRVLPHHLVPFERRCEFPIGDPRAEDFRFCGEARQAGSPYCACHHKRCYRRKDELHDNRAATGGMR